MQFNYYCGKESESFAFIRIPKEILTGKAFCSLSLQAKMLYGVLLDRMSLSMRNEWLDEENRVYIVYQISEIQVDLGFSKKKAIAYLAELEQFGLIEKKRRGLGLANIIYVKSFLAEEEETSESADSGTSGGSETALQEVAERELPEVSAGELLKSNTEDNNTYGSNDLSYPILSDFRREDETGCEKDEVEIYSELIRRNIDMDGLLQCYPEEQELVKGIFDLILETVLMKGDSVVIARNSYPGELVKGKFLKLKSDHVDYVIRCLNRNTSKVKNIKKYLLAALFNAPSTMEGYYRVEVNHDFPQYVE